MLYIYHIIFNWINHIIKAFLVSSSLPFWKLEIQNLRSNLLKVSELLSDRIKSLNDLQSKSQSLMWDVPGWFSVLLLSWAALWLCQSSFVHHLPSFLLDNRILPPKDMLPTALTKMDETKLSKLCRLQVPFRSLGFINSA